MLWQRNRTCLLLVFGLLAYILYQSSKTDLNLIYQQNVKVSEEIRKDFDDKDAEEIPVLDENKLYPKPGGGYCNMTSIKEDEYFRAMEKPTVRCNDLRKYAQYPVCLDGFKNKNNCLGLSFGINYDFGFDDKLIDNLGCQVYSFDPTLDKIPHIRKGGKNMFFNLGISSYKGSKTIVFEKKKHLNIAVDRYVNIVKMLGLTDKRIDFFKMDIEGSELDFFLDTALNHPELLENIVQIQMEHHITDVNDYWEKMNPNTANSNSTTPFDMMKIVNILYCHGFALTYTSMRPKTRPLQVEATWIRA